MSPAPTSRLAQNTLQMALVRFRPFGVATAILCADGRIDRVVLTSIVTSSVFCRP